MLLGLPMDINLVEARALAGPLLSSRVRRETRQLTWLE